MNVNETKLKSIIKKYVYSFYDCAYCPLNYDGPKDGRDIDGECIDYILDWLEEEENKNENRL